MVTTLFIVQTGTLFWSHYAKTTDLHRAVLGKPRDRVILWKGHDTRRSPPRNDDETDSRLLACSNGTQKTAESYLKNAESKLLWILNYALGKSMFQG